MEVKYEVGEWTCWCLLCPYPENTIPRTQDEHARHMQEVHPDAPVIRIKVKEIKHGR